MRHSESRTPGWALVLALPQHPPQGRAGHSVRGQLCRHWAADPGRTHTSEVADFGCLLTQEPSLSSSVKWAQSPVERLLLPAHRKASVKTLPRTRTHRPLTGLASFVFPLATRLPRAISLSPLSPQLRAVPVCRPFPLLKVLFPESRPWHSDLHKMWSPSLCVHGRGEAMGLLTCEAHSRLPGCLGSAPRWGPQERGQTLWPTLVLLGDRVRTVSSKGQAWYPGCDNFLAERRGR